jgi:hypothetical protein
MLQNGIVSEHPAPIRQEPRYIITGRDLAEFVHNDTYECYTNACNILMDWKVPFNPGLQQTLKDNPTERFFINCGKPDMLAAITMIGRNSLLAAWNHKWNDMMLRPEAYGIEVERVFKDKRNRYGVAPDLLRNPVLQAIISKFDSHLLTQVYPEGCPLHPSTPAGHAAIAGACITVLKFFFEERFVIDIYEPDSDGVNLLLTGQKASILDELHKLAYNISIGRNWAGVHYYMDSIRGLELGESVAIDSLKDLICRYPHKTNITFTRFNGTSITISS